MSDSVTGSTSDFDSDSLGSNPDCSTKPNDMMTEQEFFERLYDCTGWSMHQPEKNRSFGFIFGVHSPFLPEGMTGAGNFKGFNMWKRQGSIGVEVAFTFTSSEDALNKAMDFLNTPFPSLNEKGRMIIVGEFPAKKAE